MRAGWCERRARVTRRAVRWVHDPNPRILVLGIWAIGLACCIGHQNQNQIHILPNPHPPQTHRVMDHVDRLHRSVVGCVYVVLIAVRRRHELGLLHRRSKRGSHRTHLNAAHSRARLRVWIVVVYIHLDRAFALSADLPEIETVRRLMSRPMHARECILLYRSTSLPPPSLPPFLVPQGLGLGSGVEGSGIFCTFTHSLRGIARSTAHRGAVWDVASYWRFLSFFSCQTINPKTQRGGVGCGILLALPFLLLLLSEWAILST
jgi:hypothetical protein